MRRPLAARALSGLHWVLTIALLAALAVPACGGRDAWLREPLPERPPVDPPAVLPPGAPRVRVTTSVGEFVVALYADRAPETVANFLRYVDEEFYDDTVFHRVENAAGGLAVIQGGGLTADLRAKPTHQPIRNEADNGLSNRRGTIAMARLTEPHSATAQFFLNYQDNLLFDDRSDRDPGYAVFGVVIEGMDVVDRISLVPTAHVPGTHHNSVPMVEIVIERARRQ